MEATTGNSIRYRGTLRIYKNGAIIQEQQYNLLDAFPGYNAITLLQLQNSTDLQIEDRAAAMIEYITGQCPDFINIINEVIIENSSSCNEEEEEFMIGQIISFASNAGYDTEKWLVCNGTTLLVTDYPDLFAVIGRIWTADAIPASQFQLPNLTDRFLVTAGGDYSVGATGGEKTHTLTILEMPSHNHILKLQQTETDDGGKYNTLNPNAAGTTSQTTTALTGEGQAHENRPPYAAVVKLIRVKQ